MQTFTEQSYVNKKTSAFVSLILFPVLPYKENESDWYSPNETNQTLHFSTNKLKTQEIYRGWLYTIDHCIYIQKENGIHITNELTLKLNTQGYINTHSIVGKGGHTPLF